MKKLLLNKQFLVFAFFILVFSSCKTKNEPVPQPQDTLPDFSQKPGIFIINEGIFQWGNGSIDFWSPKSQKLYHDIFKSVNQRATGDVVQLMTIIGNKAWIIVNNSGLIEIVDLKSFKSLHSLSNFTSPRYLLKSSNNKIYVSDLYRPVIYVLDTLGNKLKEISLQRSAEQLIEAEGKIWALNWSSYGGYDNTGITLINPLSDQAESYIRLSKEPNSAVIDKNGNIWVLCSGGFMHDEKPVLWKLQSNGDIYQKFEFSNPEDYPTHLEINPEGDTLYYLNRHIYALSIEHPDLPGQKLIEAQERNFYGFSAGSVLLISDALNYQTRGKVYVFSRKGLPIDTLIAGIIPGHFCRNE
ncbi:MAG: hypothetical protein PWR20_2489 [Bacteroidales bacterium]|jgi:hypothetical protein|nr:hypothetical protein [Bacteroidales bacterium]MDN5330604.1 hypothetical protein [Bacteroidales bacterium]